jgi:hypothetical protein
MVMGRHKKCHSSEGWNPVWWHEHGASPASLVICVLAVLLALQFAGCAVFKASHNVSGKYKDDIREAVFRYQFEHNGLELQGEQWVYFLAYKDDGWKSPSPEFMKRFAGLKPPVKPVSDADIEPGSGTVRDKVMLYKGIIFYIGTMEWVDENMAKVEGGYYMGNEGSRGNSYYVERQGDSWVVTKEAMHWIS